MLCLNDEASRIKFAMLERDFTMHATASRVRSLLSLSRQSATTRGSRRPTGLARPFTCALSTEVLEPRSMLSASASSVSTGIDRPVLAPSGNQAAAESPWGPHLAYVVTHVSNGTIAKLDPVSGQAVNLTATPTTRRPSTLLSHLGSQLVQPNEPLQWSPADATQAAEVKGLAVHQQVSGGTAVAEPKAVTLSPPSPPPALIEGASWPAPLFHFGVAIDGGPLMSVEQVSGTDPNDQVINYRASNSPLYHTIKMPGIAAYGTITLERVVIQNETELWQWLDEIALKTVPKTTMTVSLLNEAGSPAVTWTLHNAWPTKVLGNSLTDNGNQVKIEQILIAYETLVITDNGNQAAG